MWVLFACNLIIGLLVSNVTGLFGECECVHPEMISIEKEMRDGSKSLTARESADYHLKVQTLKERLDKCRNQITSIKGIELTKPDQIKRADVLKELMHQKRELLSNYKNRCPIDGVPRTE